MPRGQRGDFALQRARMVERQLRGRGIEDERVLEAMAEVPRDAYVPEEVRRRAYDDSALPIGYEQTISQPWVVAAICQALALEGAERVLESGTGSGYSTAVLARLAAAVSSSVAASMTGVTTKFDPRPTLVATLTVTAGGSLSCTVTETGEAVTATADWSA